MRSTVWFCLSTFMLVALSGCGTAIPNMNAIQPNSAEIFEEIELVQLIKCELHYGVQQSLARFSAPGNTGHGVEWLRNWGAKVSLKVTVDEKGSANLGTTYKRVFSDGLTYFENTVDRSFIGTAGLQASSQATRSETIGFSYAFADLLKEGQLEKGDCQRQIKNKVVVSDLKIAEFIQNKAFVANHADAVTTKTGQPPYSTFSEDITFIVTYGGSLNPVWTLTNVNLGAASPPLLNAIRTKTHNVTLTLGDPKSGQTAAVENANLIGQAVRDALDDH